MQTIKLMSKSNNTNATVAYRKKILVLDFCIDWRNVDNIMLMFIAKREKVSPRQFRYIIKVLLNKKYLEKIPNLHDLRSFLYKTTPKFKKDIGDLENE